MLVAKKLVTPGTPAAQVATAVRTLAITLYFLRRNGDPIAVTADLAGDPITVFNSRLRGRTVSLVAAWHGAVVWHHPGGIKPLMDDLVLRRMVMLLRHCGTDGEAEDAGYEKGQDVSVHSKLRHSNLRVRKVQEA
jgi:hypothetical protein